MARIPDDLARDLVEWAATAWRVDDSSGDVYCHYCGAHEPIGGEADHADDCKHVKAMYWLAAEKAAREWRPRAVEVTYRYEGKLSHAGEGDDD